MNAKFPCEQTASKKKPPSIKKKGHESDTIDPDFRRPHTKATGNFVFILVNTKQKIHHKFL